MPPDRVEVEWLDSESDSSWLALPDALREAEPDNLHRSCGYLLADTERYVFVGLNYREGSESERPMVADTIRIPRAVVLAVHRLRRA
jgi:hypothetical protein